MKALDTNELKSLVEALVFVSDTPVRLDKLAEALQVDRTRLNGILDLLEQDYAGRGIHLVRVAGGVQFRTDARFAEQIRAMQKSRPFRFSRAALECLAIIAYRQPVTRGDIEYLRGVDSGGVIKTLLDKRLIRILGKKDVAGRPLIYGTSREFLEVFGLHSLEDLPTLKEFSDLDLELAEEAAATVPAEPTAEADEPSVH
ncbi:MAG: SMC-Scp complex subunit ScpB [Deltaproteobacteria bacterium]|nr:MAG: SMC-Scp complex subunit ScpB [Deltaproteobacteria bacterium]